MDPSLFKIFVKSKEGLSSPNSSAKASVIPENTSAVHLPMDLYDANDLDFAWKDTSSSSSGPEDEVVFVEKVTRGTIHSDKNSVFKAVERNNIEHLQKAVKVGFFVDMRDNFGWTPLMSAVAACAVDCIKILIEHGADSKAKDNAGMSVWELAREKGMERFLETPTKNQTNSGSDNDIECVQEYFCDTCQSHITESSVKTHKLSVVHLINLGPGKSVPSYEIPESNLGYQMMLKTGWDPHIGLGPLGEGRKLPPKTVLKKSRAGLGGEKLKSKVTHFKAFDTSGLSLTHKPVTLYKLGRPQRVKRTAEKGMEAQLRLELE